MRLGAGHQPIPEADLPPGWITSSIGDACEMVQGGRLGLTKEKDYRSSGFSAYSAAGQDGFVEASEFKQEGVVLSAIGANCGRCFYAHGKWTTLANVQAILPDIQRLSAKFLYHRANVDGFWPRSGSAQPFIKPSDVLKCWVAHPKDISEQSRIAAVLDTVDEAIVKTEGVIAKLKQVRAGLLHDLLTRGLDEHGQLRDPVAHPEQFQDSPLGRIPREWKVSPFREFGTSDRPYLKTGPFGSSLKQEHWVAEGVPVVTIGSLGEGEFIPSEILHVSKETARVLAAYSLLPGDIVFSRVADVGRSVVVTEAERGWIISSNMMWISLDRKKADPRYVQLNISANAMVRRQIETLVNSAGREVANAAVINSLRLPWAPYTEQKRIVLVLRATDTHLHGEQITLNKLYLLKSGLMHDLLTGRMRVPEGIADGGEHT